MYRLLTVNMPYISTIHINSKRTQPFPYDIPAIKFAKDLVLKSPVSFFIGENGMGKSTLLETIACQLQLPHLDGSTYAKRDFKAARTLVPHLKLTYDIFKTIGFFMRAEDFGDQMNSVERGDAQLKSQMSYMEDEEIPEQIFQEMRNNANYQLYHMRKNFGQELSSFSHGEAFLHIIHQKISAPGIYLLDELETALSPVKQLALIYFILEHLKIHRSQFLIATHSPILMAYPHAQLFEITEEGMFERELEELAHFTFTRGFLNNPDMYLRYLDEEE